MLAEFAILIVAAVSGWQYSTEGLHYEVTGAGDSVVLIHGAGLDARMWSREFEYLQARHRVVRYDVRGFGGSPATGSAPTEDLLELLDELAIDSAVFVGLSLGGAIALQFAFEHPQRVNGLVLSAPAVPGAPPNADAGRPYGEAVQALREGRVDEGIELWLRTPAVRLFTDDPAAHGAVRMMTRENLARQFDPRRPPAAAPREPVYPNLESMDIPTMVLVGSSDAPHLVELARSVVTRMPCATLRELDGVGHIANLDAPDAFLQAVSGFLRGPESAAPCRTGR